LLVLAWKLDKDYQILGGVIGGSGEGSWCYPQSFTTDAQGLYVQPEDSVCYQGEWVDLNRTGGNESYCDGYSTLVTVRYEKGLPVITKQEAKGDEFCYNNTIIASPQTCGNYRCDAGETDTNCWVDCGPVQDWAKMKALESDPSLSPYYKFVDVFVVGNEVEQLAKEVEASEPATPLEAIRTLTRLIGQNMDYVRGGVAGNAQCGETPELILSRGYGNCLDYSVVMVATLRRGFDVPNVGRVKIPSRQVAGCLSAIGTWKAQEYLVSEQQALAGQILGHSWIEIPVGNGRWNMADPTSDVSLAKTWLGYHRIESTAGAALCYVALDSESFCRVYSESSGD
jgi:Transglutaminase-like superfamily